MRVSLSEWDFRHILQLTISESSLTEYQIGLVRERVGDLFPRYAAALLVVGAALRSSKAWLCATVEWNRAMPKRRVGSPKRRIVISGKRLRGENSLVREDGQVCGQCLPQTDSRGL